MRIRYDLSYRAWKGFDGYAKQLASRPGVRKVLDIGGGANPAFPLDWIREHGIEYVLLDVSEEELAKAPKGYEKVVADITDPRLELEGGYDLIVSRNVAEHVRSGLDFHINIGKLLRSGGTAFHFFPTLYAPPFVVNLLLPARISERILLLLQPGREREGKHGKFTTYYSWCRGPLKSQIKKFRSVGFGIEEYIGFYGHGAYYGKVKPVQKLHERICSVLVRHPVPWLTSFAYVVLSRDHE